MNCKVQNVFVISRDTQEKASQCQSCMKKTLCPAYELASAQQADGTSGMFQKTVQPGQPVFRAGDKFEGIYMVRSGFFKSYFIDADGVMQLTGFHFPGEIFGIDGIEAGSYNDSVEALDTGSVCKIPLSLFTESSGRVTNVSSDSVLRLSEYSLNGVSRMLPLMKIMSRTISRDRNMIFALGKMCAKRRFATFLLDLSSRMAQSGYDATELRLCMSRTDISNYLCLALETVSRLFTQLQAEKVISIDRRNMKILNMQALQALTHEEAAGATLLARTA